MKRYYIRSIVTATVTELWEISADSPEHARELMDSANGNVDIIDKHNLEFKEHISVEDEVDREITDVTEVA